MHNDWIQIRSDHACIMHKSETEWMHARGQPASARAWPAASGQLAGWRVASARVDPVSGFSNLKIQALNPENLLRAPCKFQYSALNLEIGSKSEPKIYKIQCSES